MTNIINSIVQLLNAGAMEKGVELWMFTASQIIGIIITILVIVAMQFKSMKAILAGQIASNSLSMLSQALVGGLSGAATLFVAVPHGIILFMYRKNNKPIPRINTIIFFVLYMLAAALLYKKPIDIIAFFTSITFILSIIQENPAKYRLLIIINSILWLIYTWQIGAFASILTYVFMITSGIIAMVRLDRDFWKSSLCKKN